jgi:hypothetical protein
MTTNIELQDMAENLKIDGFRGIIMRDQFKDLNPPLENECGIFNFNNSLQGGSHWATWAKRGDQYYYFCSYGSSPCRELIEYFKNKSILYHDYRAQGWEDVNCGEWAILFLYLFNSPIDHKNYDLHYARVVLFLIDLA